MKNFYLGGGLVTGRSHYIWERSGPYSGYQKNPEFSEMPTRGDLHSASAFYWFY